MEQKPFLGDWQEPPLVSEGLTLIGLAFFTCLGLRGGGGGGRCLPLLSSLLVDLSQRNFVQGLTIKALAQMWKMLHKINKLMRPYVF